MSIESPPPFVQTMLFILVGENFPKGDEDKMRTLGDAWKKLAKSLEPLDTQLHKVSRTLGEAGTGPAIDTAQEFINNINGDTEAVFAKLGKAFAEVGASARKVGNDLEHAKWMIIAFATMLAYTLASYAFINLFTAGAATPAAAAATKSAQEAARQVLLRLLAAVVFGAAFMGGLDLILQLLQVAMGKKEFGEIDWKRVGLMAGLGALGGVFGWTLSGLKGGIGAVFRNAVSEGGVELVADSVQNKGLVTEDGKTSATGGAMSGAIEGGLEHGKNRANSTAHFTDSSFLKAIGSLLGLNLQLGQTPTAVADPAPTNDSTPETTTRTAPVTASTPGTTAPGATESKGTGGKTADTSVGSTGKTSTVTGPGTTAGTASSGTSSDTATAILADVAPRADMVVDVSTLSDTTRQLLPDGNLAAAFDGSRPELTAALLDPQQQSLRDEVFQSTRRAALDNVARVLDQSIPEQAGEPPLRTEIRERLKQFADRTFENTFGMLVVPIDWHKLHGDVLEPLRPTSRQELSAMAQTWQGFLTRLQLAAANNGPGDAALGGLVAVQMLTEATVQQTTGNLLDTEPSLKENLSTLGLVTMNESQIAQVQQRFLDQLGSGPATLEAVAASVKASIDAEQTAAQVRAQVGGSTVVKEADAQSIVTARGNRYLPSTEDGPEELAAAESLPRFRTPGGQDWLAVVAHGHLVDGRLQVGESRLTPQQFADLVQTWPDWQQRPLLLVVCRAGSIIGSAAFAAEVRDLLGIDVIAGAGDVVSMSNGNVQVSTVSVTASGRLIVQPATVDGGWLLFPDEAGSASRPLGPDLMQAMQSLGQTGMSTPAPDPAVGPSPVVRWTQNGSESESDDGAGIGSIGTLLPRGRSGRRSATTSGGLDAVSTSAAATSDTASTTSDTAVTGKRLWAGAMETMEQKPDRAKDLARWRGNWHREFKKQALNAGFEVTTMKTDGLFEALSEAFPKAPPRENIRQVIAERLREARAVVKGGEKPDSELEQFVAGLSAEPTTVDNLYEIISGRRKWDPAATDRLVQVSALALDLPLKAVTNGALKNYRQSEPFPESNRTDVPVFRLVSRHKGATATSLREVIAATTAAQVPSLREWLNRPAQGLLSDDIKSYAADKEFDEEDSGSLTDEDAALIETADLGTTVVVPAATSEPIVTPIVTTTSVQTETVDVSMTFVETSDSTPAPRSIDDVVWVMKMVPVLEARIAAARKQGHDTEQAQRLLGELRILLSVAGQNRQLPKEPLAQPDPWRLDLWRRMSRQRLEAFDMSGLTRVQQSRLGLMFRHFGSWAGAQDLRPDTIRDEHYLPLLRAVFGPEVQTVTDTNLATLDDMIDSLLAQNQSVTVHNLVWRNAVRTSIERYAQAREIPLELVTGTIEAVAPTAVGIAPEPIRQVLTAYQVMANRSRAGMTAQERVGQMLDLSTQFDARPETEVPLRDHLSMIDRLAFAAIRHHRKHHRGVHPRGALTAEHLFALMRAKLGPQAPATVDGLLHLDALLQARRGQSRWLLRQIGKPWRDSVVRVRPDGSLSPVNQVRRVYKQVAAWQERKWQKIAGGPDSSKARADEVTALKRSFPTIDRKDLADLVWLRRKYFADGRYRQHTDISAYQAMTMKLLGESSGINAERATQMVTLLHAARDQQPNVAQAAGQSSVNLAGQIWHRVRRPKTYRSAQDIVPPWRLDAILWQVVRAKWNQPGDARSEVLNVAGVDADHSKLVTGLHSIDPASVDSAALAKWLNGIVPGATDQVNRTVVQRKLVSLFGQALDDGANIRVKVGDQTYDIRLWAVPTAAPQVDPRSLFPVGEGDSNRFKGKAEYRTYQYNNQQVSRSSGTQRYGEGGFSVKGPLDVGLNLAGQVGGSTTQTQATAVSRSQQLRIKETLGYMELPVSWVAQVEHTGTGRWRDFALEDTGGGYKQDTIRYAVPEFNLNYGPGQLEQLRAEVASLKTQPEGLTQSQLEARANRSRQIETLIANAELGESAASASTPAARPPLWNMDMGVTRVKLSGAVLREIRTMIGAEEYGFWKPQLEAELSNDQLTIGLADILRPHAGFQERFRVNLQHGDRYLQVSLTPKGASPITKVEKISEVSRSGETRFDKVDTTVALTGAANDKARGVRTGATARFDRVVEFAYRRLHNRRHAEQWARTHRAWWSQAKRVVGRMQLSLVEFEVDVSVSFGSNSLPAKSPDAKPVAGFAHIMVDEADLNKIMNWPETETTQKDGDQLAALDEKERARTDKLGSSTWFTPGPAFGLSMDYVESLGKVDELYDTVVEQMVQAGYLPKTAKPEAVRPEGAEGEEIELMAPATRPWDHLNGLDGLQAPINSSPQELIRYANWRNLVSQLAHRSLRARADDVFSGDAYLGASSDRPGVVFTFQHPEGGRQMTVSLSAAATDSSTHQEVTKFQIQFGHTGIDGMARKVVNSTSHESGKLAGVRWQVRLAFESLFSRTSSRQSGENKSVAIGSDTDGQRMDASRYQIGIRWHLRLDEGAVNRHESWLDADAQVLQPDVLESGTWAYDWTATPSPAPRNESVLSRMHSAIYTVLAVKGVDMLQEKVKQSGLFTRAELATGLAKTVYQSEVMRAIGGTATLPIGPVVSSLSVQPFGRPQIMKMWYPYTQQVLESQLGREQSADSTRQTGLQVLTGARAGDPNGAEVGQGHQTTGGEGAGEASLNTQGSYRGMFQDTPMVMVRTRVMNTVLIPGADAVRQEGELVLNVLLSDVAKHRSQFDDPTGAMNPATVTNNADRDTFTKVLAENPEETPDLPLTQPFRHGLTADLQARLSLQDGRSWTAMWPLTFDDGYTGAGLGALRGLLDSLATRVGKSEADTLTVAIGALSGWTGPIMSKLDDGGNRWEFTAGGKRYDLVIEAETVGPPRDSRPSGTGLKVYNRSNDSQENALRTIRSEGTSVTLNGFGETPSEVGVLATRTAGSSNKVTDSGVRGSNLLSMEGLRASGMTDFTQAVKFTATLREIGILGVAETVTDSVITDLVVTVPTESTNPKGLEAYVFDLSLSPTVPEGRRIEGVYGLKSIFNAVAATHIPAQIDAANDQPAAQRLDFETMRGNLEAMLRPEGVTFKSIAIGGKTLNLGDGEIRVRAKLGLTRQVHPIAKAEMEGYDHGTDLSKQSSVMERKQYANTAVRVVTPMAPGVSAGGRAAHGWESSTTRAIDDVNWIEHRAWLRTDSSVFSIYNDLSFEIEVIRGTRRQTVTAVGATELVLGRQGALDFGIPEDVLDHAASGTPPTTLHIPQGPAGTVTDELKAIIDKNEELLKALEDMKDSFFNPPAPRTPG